LLLHDGSRDDWRARRDLAFALALVAEGLAHSLANDGGQIAPEAVDLPAETVDTVFEAAQTSFHAVGTSFDAVKAHTNVGQDISFMTDQFEELPPHYAERGSLAHLDALSHRFRVNGFMTHA
jgi:hypothetical protein